MRRHGRGCRPGQFLRFPARRTLPCRAPADTTGPVTSRFVSTDDKLGAAIAELERVSGLPGLEQLDPGIGRAVQHHARPVGHVGEELPFRRAEGRHRPRICSRFRPGQPVRRQLDHHATVSSEAVGTVTRGIRRTARREPPIWRWFRPVGVAGSAEPDWPFWGRLGSLRARAGWLQILLLVLPLLTWLIQLLSSAVY